MSTRNDSVADAALSGLFLRTATEDELRQIELVKAWRYLAMKRLEIERSLGDYARP